MRSVEELQATELHERDVAPRQLELQRRAVVRGAEEDRLRLQTNSGLAVLQNLLDDEARLIGFVAHGDQLRAPCGGAFGPEVLGEALGGQIDHGVRGSKDWLRRAIVPIERDDLGRLE